MIYDDFYYYNNIIIAGGDSYVNPWSKECAKNTAQKLKQFGSQLEGLHQGEGESWRKTERERERGGEREREGGGERETEGEGEIMLRG